MAKENKRRKRGVAQRKRHNERPCRWCGTYARRQPCSRACELEEKQWSR